tara:strand:+ start:741 stop:986 length:246 start_codon:yes stop_codon:yes gene_type:complete
MKTKNETTPTPRRIPNPDTGRVYATEEAAVRAAKAIKIDARFLVVPANLPRFQDGGWRVIFVANAAEQIAPLLGTGHQIIN